MHLYFLLSLALIISALTVTAQTVTNTIRVINSGSLAAPFNIAKPNFNLVFGLSLASGATRDYEIVQLQGTEVFVKYGGASANEDQTPSQYFGPQGTIRTFNIYPGLWQTHVNITNDTSFSRTYVFEDRNLVATNTLGSITLAPGQGTSVFVGNTSSPRDVDVRNSGGAYYSQNVPASGVYQADLGVGGPAEGAYVLTEINRGTTTDSGTVFTNGQAITFSGAEGLALDSTLQQGFQVLKTIELQGLQNVVDSLNAGLTLQSSANTKLDTVTSTLGTKLDTVATKQDSQQSTLSQMSGALLSANTARSQGNSQLTNLNTALATSNIKLTSIDSGMGSLITGQTTGNGKLDTVNGNITAFRSEALAVGGSNGVMQLAMSGKIDATLAGLWTNGNKIDLAREQAILNAWTNGGKIDIVNGSIVNLRDNLETNILFLTANQSSIARTNHEDLFFVSNRLERVIQVLETNGVQVTFTNVIQNSNNLTLSVTNQSDPELLAAVRQLTNNPYNPTVEGLIAQANSLSSTGSAHFDSMLGMVTVPPAATFTEGSIWTVPIGGQDVDLNPMHVEHIPEVASKVREIITWFLVAGLIGAIFKIGTEYNLASAQTQQVSTPSLPGGAGVLLSVIYLVVITVAVTAISFFMVTWMTDNGSYFSTLGSNPFSGGSGPVQAGLYLLDQFVPLQLVLTCAVTVLIFRLTIGQIFFVKSMLVRVCVGG